MRSRPAGCQRPRGSPRLRPSRPRASSHSRSASPRVAGLGLDVGEADRSIRASDVGLRRVREPRGRGSAGRPRPGRRCWPPRPARGASRRDSTRSSWRRGRSAPPARPRPACVTAVAPVVAVESSIASSSPAASRPANSGAANDVPLQTAKPPREVVGVDGLADPPVGLGAGQRLQAALEAGRHRAHHRGAGT